MSPRWNWDSPTPLAASECALPPGPKGGGAHSPVAKGVGESQFQRLEKRLALCLLCAASYAYRQRRVSNDTFNLREGQNPGRKPCHLLPESLFISVLIGRQGPPLSVSLHTDHNPLLQQQISRFIVTPTQVPQRLSADNSPVSF
jgi:hypothetical protein